MHLKIYTIDGNTKIEFLIIIHTEPCEPYCVRENVCLMFSTRQDTNQPSQTRVLYKRVSMINQISSFLPFVQCFEKYIMVWCPFTFITPAQTVKLYFFFEKIVFFCVPEK